MQRDTAMVVLGIGVAILLALVVFAMQTPISRQREPREGIQAKEREGTQAKEMERSPAVPPSSPSTMSVQATQTLPPATPPAVIYPGHPSIPAAASPTVTPVVPTPAAAPAPSAAPPAPSAAAVPLQPSIPPSVSPQLPPSKPEPEPDNEALRWAKQLIVQYRPQWHIRLAKAVDPALGNEGFAVVLEPNAIEVSARSYAGWLYGLLEIAERLINGETIPAQWRWVPSVPERGLVERITEWLATKRLSPTAARTLARQRLRELAQHRLNVWVLECTGKEGGLPTLLSALQELTPLYGVRVVLWASSQTPAVRAWVAQGGQIVSASPSTPSGITVATDLGEAARYLELGQAAFPFQNGQLFAPHLPSEILKLPVHQRRWLIALVGLKGAHEGLLWFDPAWAHQLVRAMRDARLGGFWLQVRSVPTHWGVAAFTQAVKTPDADGEALWVSRWQRRWGAFAPQWLTVFREVSRIMPEVLWLLGTDPENGQTFRPQLGVPLTAFFNRRPIDKEWGFQVLSVPETLHLNTSPNTPSVLTAQQIARRLEQRAQIALNTLAQLPEPSEPDWRLAKRETLLNAWLGQHFAFKVNAALAWGQFERGNPQAGQACLTALSHSVKAWEQVVAIANTLYPPNNLWVQRLPEWQRELTAFSSRILGVTP